MRLWKEMIKVPEYFDAHLKAPVETEEIYATYINNNAAPRCHQVARLG